MTPRRQFVSAHTKTRRARTIAIVAGVALIFAVPVLRNGVGKGAAFVGTGISRGAHSVGGFFASIGTGFRSKNKLAAENAALTAENADLNAQVESENAIVQENTELKAAMGRTDPSAHFIFAAVIDKPPHSVYDTLVIDGGSGAGIAVGQTVYANGDTPIGTVAETMQGSALVKLYSAPGVATDARLSPSDTDITLTGRGGGDFSADVPHDLVVSSGATAVSKEFDPSVIAVFQKVTSDPRDPFQTLLLAAPINVNGLSFVEVRQ